MAVASSNQLVQKLWNFCNVLRYDGVSTIEYVEQLPTGIFYAQGVKANVVFCDRKPAAADPWTKETWGYDLRTNKHFTLKANPLRSDDLADFVDCYRAEDRSRRVETERFRRFTYDELIARDKTNLDITWLRDESLDDASTLPAPGVLAAEIVEELEAALASSPSLRHHCRLRASTSHSGWVGE